MCQNKIFYRNQGNVSKNPMTKEFRILSAQTSLLTDGHHPCAALCSPEAHTDARHKPHKIKTSTKTTFLPAQRCPTFRKRWKHTEVLS